MKKPARIAAAGANTTDGADNAGNEDGADYSGGADNAATPTLRRGSSLLELCKNEQWADMIDELARSSQARGTRAARLLLAVVGSGKGQ